MASKKNKKTPDVKKDGVKEDLIHVLEKKSKEDDQLNHVSDELIAKAIKGLLLNK